MKECNNCEPEKFCDRKKAINYTTKVRLKVCRLYQPAKLWRQNLIERAMFRELINFGEIRNVSRLRLVPCRSCMKTTL